MFRGLWESHGISTLDVCAGLRRGETFGFLARKLQQAAMQEELGKLIPKVQAR